MNQYFSVLVLLIISSTLTAQDDGFRPLYNGKNLDGWESYGGDAPYIAEGKSILGTAIVSRNNTFLCTDRPYGDFVLELEFNNEAPLNSGVMARGQWRKSGDIRQIFGYQIEIDPLERAYTGGVYDEARRGWIYPLHYNPPARKAMKTGAWNTMRIEFIGNELRTFVNNVPVSNLVDDIDASGMICLQIHAVPKELEGKEMRWRNIRIKEGATKADQRTGPVAPQINLVPNTISDWEQAKLNGFPAKGWEVSDGELHVQAGNGGESTNGGDIITNEHFRDFDLRFEFKPTEGANSGIKYFVDPSLNKGSGSAIGLEFQILDDRNHPDAKMGVAGNRTAGSLYDLITAKVLDTPRGKELKIDAWNRGRIVVRGGKVEHWLNGYKVVEYDRFSQMFEALVNYSKYKDWENFGRWPAGPILLQDHGDSVFFRSIKIREL
jgi:hypothetical protein